MKQVQQNIKSGQTEVVEVPVPAAGTGLAVIRTSKTLISAGTERMLVDFGRAGWVSKARQQPDKVRMVADKVRTDGLLPTIDAISSKLDQPLALGYCNVGIIADLGEDVPQFALGDRVVSNGQHAEFVSVPRNLVARIPDGVPDESAVFTVMAAIGLQGIRLARPTMGECFVVTGLGLIGLLTVQMLRSNGCRVLGLDFDPDRLALAQTFGAETVNLARGEDPIAAAESFSRGRGVDGVLITASTKSNEPVSQAATMCRKRGRIILVGVTGLALSRSDFYEKELSFQVSCSYGPGRYDPAYEEKGNDYPIAYVRWTEQRNFEAVLDLMASGQLNLEPLITHRFGVDEAAEAYDVLVTEKTALGITLDYPSGDTNKVNRSDRVVALDARPAKTDGNVSVSFIGAGNYGGRVLIPEFRRAGVALGTVVSSRGVSGVHYGKKHQFAKAATDAEVVFEDEDTTAVVIATRHDSHAEYVLKSIERGKHVFVEKPLCLTDDELDSIEAASQERPESMLMVGFNRRFSPLTVKMKDLLDASAGPKSFVMLVNAGEIPADHWTQDLAIGGGRIVGEGCHFIDLIRHLAGSPIVDFATSSLGDESGAIVVSDKASVTLNFQDGSCGVIHYLANGHKAFPKERLEVFCGNKVLQLDNFRKLRAWGWKNFSGIRLWRQDKGQANCVAAFVDAIRNGTPCPIPIDEVLEVSRVSIAAQRSLS